MQQFAKWFKSLQVAPAIKLLQQRFGALQQAEIAKYGKWFASTEREQLEKYTRSLCNKILHRPRAFLRQLSEDGTTSDRLAAVDMIRHMFDLEVPEQDE